MHAMSIVILRHLINTAGSFQLHIHYKNKKKKGIYKIRLLSTKIKPFFVH